MVNNFDFSKIDYKIKDKYIHNFESLVLKNDEEESLLEYLRPFSPDYYRQLKVAANWNVYSDRVKEMLTLYKIDNIDHVELLSRYTISNITLDEDILANQILLRHVFITEDIENYIRTFSTREEFVIRLRTGTIKNYDKDLEAEYNTNNLIIKYELSVNTNGLIARNNAMVLHLDLLNDLVINNFNIGYTRREKFNILFNKIITKIESEDAARFYSKIDSYVNNIYELLQEIKEKLLMQNQLIEKIMLFFDELEEKVYSLEECAKFYDVSRERIRQIEEKAVNKLLYKFDDYENDEVDYIKNFSFKINMHDIQKYALLHPVVVLITKNTKSSKDIKDFFKTYNLFNTHLFNEYLNDTQQCYFDGNYLKKTKSVLFNYYASIELIKKKTIEEIEIGFKSFLIENNLKELSQFDDRTVEGLLERNKNIVKSKGFYHEVIGDTKIINDFLENKLSSMPSVFSTKIIYNMNPEMFLRVNILDYYELHNFYKKNFDNKKYNLKFKRVPHIFKGDENLESFLQNYEDRINSGEISINDIANMTGIAPETLVNIKSNL